MERISFIVVGSQDCGGYLSVLLSISSKLLTRGLLRLLGRSGQPDGNFVIVLPESRESRRNSNAMRTPSLHAERLVQLLQRRKIATMAECKKAFGTKVDVSVFRKLKPLEQIQSSHSP